MPAGIGIARNTLGQAICEPTDLYVNGPEGCPANSRVGFGAATAEVPYGPEIVSETAHVYAYRGETEDEHTTVLFFAEGWYPVFADLVFPGHLLEDTGPFSGQIDTEVPIIPSLPGAADVSVVHLSSSFGPEGLTYYRLLGDREVAFKPRGITVPLSCPPGGYPFAGEFTFQAICIGTDDFGIVEARGHDSMPAAARGRGPHFAEIFFAPFKRHHII